ncbi:hypothetical protein D9757_002947 [Collybiopsis confluens]|uniref:Glycosyltransferase family 25 protein n=1 Tax=Collybiopsis confluens TaxID=2823264 RepID=A0A8H5HW81_9AGAR|nr:hypothetical protein D9757_002947 [Collybiopsis confluens]
MTLTATARSLLLVFVFVFFSLTFYLYNNSPVYLTSVPQFSATPHSLDLGFISKTYVISLPNRDDRRKDINRLMDALNFTNWVYHDATYANSSFVQSFLHHVQARRSEHEDYSLQDTIHLPFSWPEDANNQSYAYPAHGKSIPFAGAELWTSKPSPDITLPEPMICAEDDFRLTRYSVDMPQWRYLTSERVSAFHSHLTAIRRVVDDNAAAGVSLKREQGTLQKNIVLVLEDDVDMEIDIKERLQVLVPMLPYDWDMLFLGFCWSQEINHAVLEDPYLIPKKNKLYPSFQPRCLHAYALSPAGAVRVLTHLRHEQFAYGRSVDLATEWLVWGRRVKSFTVVPPVSIQRKLTKSSITLAGGAVWKESLEEGALGTKDNGNEV